MYKIITDKIIIFPANNKFGNRPRWYAECLTEDHRHFIIEGNSPEEALKNLLKTLQTIKKEV